MMFRKPQLAISAIGLLLAGGAVTAETGKRNPFPEAASVRRPVSPRAPMVIPAGTLLRVKLNESIETSVNRPGDEFRATLEAPLVVSGKTIAGRGTQLSGLVQEARSSGRLKGRAHLVLTLNGIEAGGHHVRLTTTSLNWQGDSHKERNFGWFGGAFLSGKHQVRLPAESPVSFRLERPAMIEP